MKIWIYTDGAQKGPFSEQELLGMNLTESTPVWFEGMVKWMPAGQVTEMQPILRGELPAEDSAKEEEHEVEIFKDASDRSHAEENPTLAETQANDEVEEKKSETESLSEESAKEEIATEEIVSEEKEEEEPEQEEQKETPTEKVEEEIHAATSFAAQTSTSDYPEEFATPITAAFEAPEFEPCPSTYIGWSIFLTICCCSPLTLGALIASIFVTVFYNRGKIKKSKKASEIAAWLIMISIALGFFPLILMLKLAV